MIEKYYMDWRPLFSDAYVKVYLSKRAKMISKLPPLRYWQGPARYYFGDKPILYANLFNKVYFMIVAILPLVSLSCFVFYFMGHVCSSARVKCVE